MKIPKFFLGGGGSGGGGGEVKWGVGLVGWVVGGGLGWM